MTHPDVHPQTPRVAVASGCVLGEAFCHDGVIDEGNFDMMAVRRQGRRQIHGVISPGEVEDALARRPVGAAMGQQACDITPRHRHLGEAQGAGSLRRAAADGGKGQIEQRGERRLTGQGR